MSTEKPENEEEKQETPEAEAREETPVKKAAAKKEAPKKEAASGEEVSAKAAEEKPAQESSKAESPAAETKAKEAKTDAADSEDKPAEKKKSTVEELLDDGLTGVKVRRAKGSKNITHGIVHVTASFNNTKVSVSDSKGNVISWSSAGKCNFRGSRKSTAYAAQVVTQDATRAAMAHGLKEVEVHLKGPGMGRDSAVRALQALGIVIVSIMDKTPVPHNGCRPPKRRRV